MEIGDHDLHFHVDGSARSLDSAFHFLFPQVKNESIFDFGSQKSKVDSKIKKSKTYLATSTAYLLPLWTIRWSIRAGSKLSDVCGVSKPSNLFTFSPFAPFYFFTFSPFTFYLFCLFYFFTFTLLPFTFYFSTF